MRAGRSARSTAVCWCSATRTSQSRAGSSSCARTSTRGSGELIFYLRADESGLRSSSYWRAPAADPAALRELLAAAHGVLGVVAKRRRLFLHRNVRIHLDDVEGLGSFIELESVLATAGEESQAEAEALAEVIAALALAGRETIAGGYLDLMR